MIYTIKNNHLPQRLIIIGTFHPVFFIMRINLLHVFWVDF